MSLTGAGWGGLRWKRRRWKMPWVISMIEKLTNRPVISSIVAAIVVSVLYGIAMMFSISNQVEQLGIHIVTLMQVAFNIIFAAAAVYLLGVINRANGFKCVFRTKGFAKGLLALVPVAMFFIFSIVLSMVDGGLGNIDPDRLGALPVVILTFAHGTSALFQNVLFRGLLITALLLKFSNTEKERVNTVFKASALYLIIYIPFNIFGGSEIGLMQLINTFVVGSGFCAAYLYSRNILSLVFVQGVWGFVVMGLLGGQPQESFSFVVFIIFISILVLIIFAAVRFGRRADPFALNQPENHNDKIFQNEEGIKYE